MHGPVLSQRERAFLVAARRAVLATIAPDGRPRLVPICFVVDDAEDEEGRTIVYSPLDEKPKAAADPRSLARVRDILARPALTLLVDTWDEDWTRLGWLRCHGAATLVEPPLGGDAGGAVAAAAPVAAAGRDAGNGGDRDPGGHLRIIGALRSKYPQYRAHALESRPMLRIAVERATSWGDLSGAALSTP